MGFRRSELQLRHKRPKREGLSRFVRPDGLYREASEEPEGTTHSHLWPSSACRGIGRGEFRDLDANLRAFAFPAANVHFELVAVEKPQTRVDVADPDAPAIHLRKALGGHAQTVVLDLNR